jgi:hypothetical protein
MFLKQNCTITIKSNHAVCINSEKANRSERQRGLKHGSYFLPPGNFFFWKKEEICGKGLYF